MIVGLTSKTLFSRKTALKVKNTMSFETKSILDVFKNYYSALVENLLKKLQSLWNKIHLTL